MNKIALLLSVTFLLSSCSSVNLKDYYYPISQDDQTVIYEYVNEKNPELTEYWKVTSDPYENTLKTDSYRANFEIYNSFYEEYKEEGAALISYIDYEKDKEGNFQEIEGETSREDVYKWDNEDSYDFAVDYTNKYGRFKMVKRRTRLGFEKVEIKDTEYKALRFKDEYFIHAIDQDDKYSFYQISYYAKDIGMIMYKRFIPNAEVRILELDRILTEDEFGEMRRKAEESKKELQF